jgi:type II secretory pathway component PulF
VAALSGPMWLRLVAIVICVKLTNQLPNLVCKYSKNQCNQITNTYNGLGAHSPQIIFIKVGAIFYIGTASWTTLKHHRIPMPLVDSAIKNPIMPRFNTKYIPGNAYPKYLGLPSRKTTGPTGTKNR